MKNPYLDLDLILAVYKHDPAAAEAWVKQCLDSRTQSVNLAQLQQIISFAKDGYVDQKLAIAIGNHYARAFMSANGIEEPSVTCG